MTPMSAPKSVPTICVNTSLCMAQATASVQLKADAAPEGTGGAYQYAIALGPTQVERMPQTSAATSAMMVTRFMSAQLGSRAGKDQAPCCGRWTCAQGWSGGFMRKAPRQWHPPCY